MQNDTNLYKQDNIANTAFLTKLNIALTSDNNVKTNIDRALGMIGKHVGCDRVQVIQIHHDTTFSIPHEWCNRSIDSVKDKTKRQKCFVDEKLDYQLNANSYVQINDIEQITNEELKDFMRTHKVHNMLLLPLFLTGNLFSFLSFSYCQETEHWQKEEVDFLTMLAAIVAANLEKNILIDKLMHRVSAQQTYTAASRGNAQ